jgi:hypothetical protein
MFLVMQGFEEGRLGRENVPASALLNNEERESYRFLVNVNSNSERMFCV